MSAIGVDPAPTSTTSRFPVPKSGGPGFEAGGTDKLLPAGHTDLAECPTCGREPVLLDWLATAFVLQEPLLSSTQLSLDFLQVELPPAPSSVRRRVQRDDEPDVGDPSLTELIMVNAADEDLTPDGSTEPQLRERLTLHRVAPHDVVPGGKLVRPRSGGFGHRRIVSPSPTASIRLCRDDVGRVVGVASPAWATVIWMIVELERGRCSS